MGSFRKVANRRNGLPPRREGLWESGLAERSPPAGGIKSEKETKDSSWVTHRIFPKQKAYASRFVYCNLILKWVLSRFFLSSLEEGRFSSPRRRAVKTAHTSLPREAFIPQG